MKVSELKDLLQNYPDDIEVIDCHARPINFVVMRTISPSKGLPNINQCKLSVADPFIVPDYSTKGKDTLDETLERAKLEKQMSPEEVSA